jgi:hypothetical protein
MQDGGAAPWSRRGFVASSGIAALGGVLAGARVSETAQPPIVPDAPIRIDCTPERFPALAIGDDDVSRSPDGRPAAFRGHADPCIRRDPTSGDLWLAYSSPHVAVPRGEPRRPIVGVETHLARSGDGGKSWRRTGRALWSRTPARFRDPRQDRARDGFLSHEVPNILPCAIGGRPAWVGARLDYFLGREGNYRDRDSLSFCLRLLAAPTPEGLASAPMVTFGHDRSSPECGVDVNLSRLSADFPPVFIPNEPALCFDAGRLYLAFVVMSFRGRSPDFPRSFVAVLSTEPRGSVRSWSWRYHGKLSAHAEARELGGEALTQVELARARDGRLLAFLTPESWNASAVGDSGRDAFFGIRHLGCAVLEVASLETPALARRADGRLALRAFLHSSVRPEHGPGAAGYDAASATGVLFTLRNASDPRDLSWSLHATGLDP